MLTYLLILGLLFLAFFVATQYNGFHYRHDGLTTFMFLTLCLVGFVIAPVALSATNRTIIEPTVHRQEIVAMSNGGQQISSDVYIFTSNVSSQPVYSYYIERTDGGLIQRTVSSSAVIYEDTEGRGYLEWETCDADGMPTFNPLLHSEACEQHFGHLERKNYRFHVPPGTVVREFSTN